MSRSHFARLSVILLVAAALSAPPAWGAPRRLPGEISPFDIFARAWDSLAVIWSEAGCDPHGGCGSGQPPSADSGCKIDPNGGCATAQGDAPIPPPSTDEGCAIDPHGGCRPGS